jgi:nucleoside-diphosphate-sugar epimerase
MRISAERVPWPMPEAARVLVTGATGFLGRACLRRLKADGIEVVGTYRGTVPEGYDHVTWAKADLTDPDAIAALCAAHTPTHLLALAWYMGPGNQQAVENFRWLQHSIDLLFAFAEAGGQRVTFCGSCMEYDWTLEEPFVEEVSRLTPTTEYGAAKSALFRVFGPLCSKLGLSGSWGRPYFLYGPDENPRRLVADVILSLLEGREALCTHGRQQRDFLHVDDVADAMVRLMWSEYEGPLNIGSGTALPLSAVIEEAGRQIGRPELIRLGAREARPDDPDLVEADTTLMRTVLGWTPRYSLETGIADTVTWWRGQLQKSGTS